MACFAEILIKIPFTLALSSLFCLAFAHLSNIRLLTAVVLISKLPTCGSHHRFSVGNGIPISIRDGAAAFCAMTDVMVVALYVGIVRENDHRRAFKFSDFLVPFF